MTGKHVVGMNKENRSRSALALRSSIFGGQVSTRDSVKFSQMSVGWRCVVEEGRKRGPQSTGVMMMVKKKRSLNEIAAEAVAAQRVASRERAPKERPELAKQSAKERPELAKQSRRLQPQRKQQRQSPAKPVRPTMRGSFYGADQPLPALVPVRQLPSYSDQTDVSDLIDDGSISSDDEWAGELTNLLGSYGAKDFSAVDRQRNHKMQATGEEIFVAEERTLRLAIERDLEERRLVKLQEGRRKERKRRKDQLVLLSTD